MRTPNSYRASGHSRRTARSKRTRQTDPTAHVLKLRKLGRDIVVGKCVTADPSKERVLAVVYSENRPLTTDFITLPVVAVRHARACGASAIILRLDHRPSCYRLPLDGLEATAERVVSGGISEVKLPISWMQSCDWQKWAYVLEDQTVWLSAVTERSEQAVLEW